jgi:hypothetical protein
MLLRVTLVLLLLLLRVTLVLVLLLLRVTLVLLLLLLPSHRSRDAAHLPAGLDLPVPLSLSADQLCV